MVARQATTLLIWREPKVLPHGSVWRCGSAADSQNHEEGRRCPAHGPPTPEPQEGQQQHGPDQPVPLVAPPGRLVFLTDPLQVTLHPALHPLHVLIIDRGAGDKNPGLP